MSWKVYGPDLNGRFGGLQGTGGLEAVILDADGTTTGVINDQFGNGVASVSGGSVTWYTTRVGAYGPLPGIQAQTLTDVSQVAASTAWRSRRIDPTGFYWLGARYYEPTSGRFLSADPMGQAASRSLYDYAGGDPVNNFDPDGRIFGTSLNLGEFSLSLGSAIVTTLGQTLLSGGETIASGAARIVGANQTADNLFNSAMENSVSGQTLAAGGSLRQAKLAAGILGATAAAELSVFGGEGLLAAYGEGALGVGNVGLTNYLAASTTMNAGISASINFAAQELSTGTIDYRELGFSAGLGVLAGYGSGLAGIARNNAEETAAYFLAKYGDDVDVSGWQTLNATLGYIDGIGSPVFEKMLHEFLVDMEANKGAEDAGLASMNSVNKTSKEGGI